MFTCGFVQTDTGFGAKTFARERKTVIFLSEVVWLEKPLLIFLINF